MTYKPSKQGDISVLQELRHYEPVRYIEEKLQILLQRSKLLEKTENP